MNVTTLAGLHPNALLTDAVVTWHEPPPVLSRVHIGGLAVQLCSPQPNAWHRFWQRVVLGVRWEKV